MPSPGSHRQTFWFQFVTTPTADTPGTTLVLHFDSQRYVFGRVAEGTQRAFIQRGIGLRKVQTVFLTGDSSWSHLGGLLGMLLTTADVHASAHLSSEAPHGRPRFHIHGPPGTAHTLASARRFIFRTGMPLSVHEYGVKEDHNSLSEPTWTDENIRVWALPAALSDSSSTESLDESDSGTSLNDDPNLQNEISSELEKDQSIRQSIIHDMFDSSWRQDRLTESKFEDVKLPAKITVRDPITKKMSSFQCREMSDASHISPDTVVLVRQPWPGSQWESLPDRKGLPHKAVSYIVRGHTQRGVFEREKAVALGLPPGPLYGKLAAGIAVETKDGRKITPEMVLGPPRSGRGIAIIDLPHKAFVTDLLSRPEWTNTDIMDGVSTFCWIASENVLAHPAIQDFIRSKSHIEHILASPEFCPNHLAMESSAASTIRLARVSTHHFSVPIHDNVPIADIAKPNTANALCGMAGASIRTAQRGLTIQIEPVYQIQEQQVVLPLDTRQVVQDVPQNVIDLVRNAAVDSEINTAPATAVREPEIVTLGTGSAIPSKYRNVSATLLHIPGYGYYLFDCGENTLGQLKRLYKPDAVNEILQNLRMIWISHLHADHHLGTLSLLQAVKQANKMNKKRKICALVADEAMIDFVRDVAGRGRNSLTAGTIHHLVCRAGRPLQRKTKGGSLLQLDDDYMRNNLHVRTLQTTWVSHCLGAQAVSVEFVNGFKISYSGDCRPSKKFALIGADSDVLIHEATFEDGLEGDAIAKKHTTTGEALGVAAQMRARNVILTHFSQRYQKIPVMTHIKPPEDILFEEGAEMTGEAVDGDVAPLETVLYSIFDDEIKHPRSLGATSWPHVPEKMNVCVAFDLMRTRVSQIKDMHAFYPAIEALFEAQHPIEQEAGPQQNAENVNPDVVIEKKTSSQNSPKQSPQSEKRRSNSDGEDEEGLKVSKPATKKQQFQQQKPQDPASPQSPTIRKIARPDSAGSRHLDLHPELTGEAGITNGGVQTEKTT